MILSYADLNEAVSEFFFRTENAYRIRAQVLITEKKFRNSFI